MNDFSDRIKKVFSSIGDVLTNNINNMVIKFKNYFKFNGDIYIELYSDDSVKINFPKYKLLVPKKKDNIIVLRILVSKYDRVNELKIKSYVYKSLILLLVYFKNPRSEFSKVKLFNLVQDAYSSIFDVSEVSKVTESDLGIFDEFRDVDYYNFSYNLQKDIDDQTWINNALINGFKFGN